LIVASTPVLDNAETVSYKRGIVLNPQDLQKLFQESGALLEGHFILSSGLHTSRYLQCARLLEDPRRAELVGRALAEQFAGQSPDLVAGPALGAVIVGHEVARAAGARFIFTERDAEGHATLRRGFRVIPGERTIVVEDVVTTGGSTREVIKLLCDAQAEVRAVACIVDRSGGRAEFDVPLVALLQLDVPAWPAAECELCRKGIPVVKPGSRK
jgi:orotate phosphoribosyltransferase